MSQQLLPSDEGTAARPACIAMLVKIASSAKLSKTFGPVGAVCVSAWEHGVEIRYKEQVVLFFDETGEWHVGFTFGDVIAGAALGTPAQFHAEVRRWLQRAKIGDTPPQREGRKW